MQIGQFINITMSREYSVVIYEFQHSISSHLNQCHQIFPHTILCCACQVASVMSNSLWRHGLYSPWNSLGQNTEVGSVSLLQGIFPTKGSNPGLLLYRQILDQLSHKGWPSKGCKNPGQRQSSPFAFRWRDLTIVSWNDRPDYTGLKGNRACCLFTCI